MISYDPTLFNRDFSPFADSDLPPCGIRERETIGGKLPTVLYVRVSSSYHGKVVLKITAVLLKNSTAFHFA